jgi:hypothetical protein
MDRAVAVVGDGSKFCDGLQVCGYSLAIILQNWTTSRL